MRNRLALLLAPVLIVPALMFGGAAAQDARGVLQAMDKATGASKVNSIQYNGTGWISFIGQNFSTVDDWPRVDLKSYTATIDYENKAGSEDYIRVQGKNPPRGGGAGFPIQGESRVQNFVNGVAAWTLNGQGQPQAQDDQAEIRQFMMWVSPHGFIKAAMADREAQVSTRHFVKTGQTFRVIGFKTMGKYRATAEVNEENLPERIVTWIPNPVMGDMQVEIRYENWRDVGNGVKFPGLIHMHQGDHPFVRGMNFMNLNVGDVKVNVPNATPALPDTVRNAEVPRVNVTTNQIAPGVWFLGGGSHNSVAVEFKDFIALVEAPLNDDRTNAVIAAAKRVIPNKPIRYVVNTHHHWDHSGGLRAAAAEGATIVTNEANKEFFQNVVLAPQSRTLSPDRLANFPFATTGPGPLKLETYQERHAISDGTQTLISYHIEGLNHAGDMAVVYLPGPKILINGDLWGPPAQGAPPPANVNPNAVALYNNIKRLKLDVTTHVPIHGNPGPNGDFDRIVGPVAAARPAGGGAAGGGE
jgi:glyoxylase-like metal-dependent hydrolase (beta-lactamase superfamily II)